MTRLNIGVPGVFKFSVGDTLLTQPEGGWRGVVKINFVEGWIDVDTFYRWTREELLSISGIAMRALLRLRLIEQSWFRFPWL